MEGSGQRAHSMMASSYLPVAWTPPAIRRQAGCASLLASIPQPSKFVSHPMLQSPRCLHGEWLAAEAVRRLPG